MLRFGGTIGIAAIVGAMVHRLGACLRRATTLDQRAYVTGLTGALAAFLVMGLVDLTFLKDWVTLVFWLLAALVARLPDLMDAASPARDARR